MDSCRGRHPVRRGYDDAWPEVFGAHRTTGDVMKESAQAALSYVRSKAKNLGISEDFFRDHDLHIHVPAGPFLKTDLQRG